MTEQLHGRVLTASAEHPVRGASVMVVSGPGPVPDIAAETDALGRFVLSALRPGNYVLRAITQDGRTGEASARLPLRQGVVIIRIQQEFITSEDDGDPEPVVSRNSTGRNRPGVPPSAPPIDFSTSEDDGDVDIRPRPRSRR